MKIEKEETVNIHLTDDEALLLRGELSFLAVTEGLSKSTTKLLQSLREVLRK